MIDISRIKTYAWSTDEYFRGEKLYKENANKIIDIHEDKEYIYLMTYTYDHDEYMSNTRFSKTTGRLVDVSCSCPQRCDIYGYCKHIVASLLSYYSANDVEQVHESVVVTDEKKKKKTNKSSTSQFVFDLIRNYDDFADMFSVYDDYDEPEKRTIVPLSLIPVIDFDNDSVYCSLKITDGNKTYVINDIISLAGKFDLGTVERFGKNYEMYLTNEALSENDRRLLSFLSMVKASALRQYSYGVNYRYVRLKGKKGADFIRSLIGYNVIVDSGECLVKEFDKGVDFSVGLSEKHKNTYEFGFNIKYEEAYFFDDLFVGISKRKKIMEIADRKTSRILNPFFERLEYHGNQKEMLISKEDFPKFYSSVIVPLGKFCTVNIGEGLTFDAPPGLEVALYIDSPDQNIVIARLEYSYGDDIYPAFSSDAKNRICDRISEKVAESNVMRYFERNFADPERPLFISDEDRIFRFISEGISELAKTMQIYASERFSNMKVRPPVHPTIGVRANRESLISLDIETEGYTMKELAQILSAYRKGLKYHRLNDGSFVQLDDEGIAEFSELAENLNITDKALLKQNINIPRYRMLYLDSLQDTSVGMHIRRSTEFRKSAEAFKNISSADYEIPDGLNAQLREYQIYGYKWLRTISAYGFGGILADDMGLGKTLQAISLMLWKKNDDEKNGIHTTSMVVCPASLTLNWESEIRKFAPTLNTSVVIGQANARADIIDNSDDVDVIITSYSILTRDIVRYEDKHFAFMIIDEAQFIKNHNTQASKAVKGIAADVRFALTGTPVENSLAELWSIYDFIMPDYLFNYSHFKKSYEIPIVKGQSEQAASALRKTTKPFILRRMKTEVLTELPDKTETTLSAELNEEQKKIYTANVLSMKKQMREKLMQGNANEGKIEFLAMLTRLRQICCDPSLVYDNYENGSAKLEQCLELVESCINSGHKVLLFSQFTSMLDIIGKRLAEMDVPYYVLTGSTKPEERLRLVNAFNTDSTKLFMISLKAGGTGLNLTGADIVIHYDPWWNVSAENQATDRAYRIGQKNSVQVYKLIAKGTIEEKIQEMQKDKKALADMADNGDGSIMKMSTEDIMSILD